MNYLKSLGIDPRLIKIGEIVMSGVRRFLELDDTPDSYDGQAGKVVKVNEGGTALKFEEMTGGGDMLKSVYDADDDGTVDNADKVDGQHASEFAAASHDHDSAYAPISKGVTNGDSHDHAGGDGAAITENALSLSDVTMANALTSKHGFCPKLPDDDTKFLDGKGNWSAPGFKGKIIYADSPAYDNVVAAINQAEPGDMVVVPKGEATWDSKLSITKGIILKGAGIDQTIINNNYDNPSDNDECLIFYKPDDFEANYPFRITGFTFNSYDKSDTIYLAHNRSSSLTIQTKIRIDHNKFTAASGNTDIQAIVCNGMRGVVDNNLFYHAYPIRHSSCYGNGQSWWNNWEGLRYGKPDNNIYYEDNIFYDVEIVANSQYANRYAMRYNTIYMAGEAYPLFDAHGNQGIGYMYSSFGVEMYGNLLVTPASNTSFNLLDHRGGKALVFMNAIVSASGSYSGSCWETIRDEYPDSLNPEDNPDYQFPNDTYYFLNRKNYTGNSYCGVTEGQHSDNPPFYNCPTEDRDYFVGTDVFDGSLGVGYGLLSNRPSNPTTVGVGYWATDKNLSNLEGMVGANPETPITGTFYKCTEPGVWTEYFMLLEYPHPLRTILGETITEFDLSLSDVETNNATTEKHGFCPKLSGNSSQYLDGTGEWSAPSGGGADNFLDLTDTPDLYTDQGGKFIKVNSGETGLEFVSHTVGDMLKSVYDTDDDGKVDSAETADTASDSDKLDGYHSSDFATSTHNHDSAYAPISKGVTNGDSHDHVGGDGAAITEAAISLSDVTDNNVSTSKHGFCPKLPNDDTKFLSGVGNWAVPSGGGGSSDAISQAINPIKKYGSNTYWIGLDGATSPATTTFTANRLFIYPISFDHDISVSTVAIQVTTAASGNVKVGLYSAAYDNGWKPATLLGSTADMDTSTTGTKTASVSWNLSKHTVYFVGLIPSAAPALRSHVNSYCRVLFVIMSGTTMNKCHMLTYDVGSYSLPSDLSSVTFAYSDAHPPTIALA